ncbi:3-oxoacyl-[acyl-carrier-protein] reductase [Anaerosalibacter massiliensis]|uniref:3-oxoacyl-[acyl-carrier-protein] reductase n=1 Tax=Anaerosalibacter massiliensis TaxID=1347392 RepID=A0A9X2MHQ8_9FIRM|nr:3-oxoacyl-[acyl-carrier-protein] reductase [Anaerosalibacter massiliensis]MCR2043315.1 3-oxoacyl-[acyl-carrier-protein] reductase [Anaerosalibacter massiliensis]
MTLSKKNALITGGSRGIGRAIAMELSRQGINIIITYNSSEEKALEVIKEVENNGVKGLAIKADVSTEEDVKNMMKTIKNQFDSVDILVNNAGVTKDNLLLRMKTEEWDKVMDTNLKGVYLCTKAVARGMMKKRYGKIINIASVVGISGNAGQGNYSASKAGVIGFTKSIAKELGSRGITVNGVAPGFVETDMTEVLSEDIKKHSLNMIPLKRFGKPEDIANVVGFLCSEKADYITGQIINVDGGMLM